MSFDSLLQIWANDAPTDAHRKALLRCLIEKVLLDRGEREVALARIVWRGGAVTDLHVKMKVKSVAKLTRIEELPHASVGARSDGRARRSNR